VSLDRDGDAYQKYVAEMPWLSVPFDQEATRHKLETRGKVKGIPTLLLYNANGSLLTKNGRKIILEGMFRPPFPNFVVKIPPSLENNFLIVSLL
jgi:nucleoredoxin